MRVGIGPVGSPCRWLRVCSPREQPAGPRSVSPRPDDLDAVASGPRTSSTARLDDPAETIAVSSGRRGRGLDEQVTRRGAPRREGARARCRKVGSSTTNASWACTRDHMCSSSRLTAAPDPAPLREAVAGLFEGGPAEGPVGRLYPTVSEAVGGARIWRKNSAVARRSYTSGAIGRAGRGRGVGALEKPRTGELRP